MLYINKIIYSLSIPVHKAGDVLKCGSFIGSLTNNSYIDLILRRKNKCIASFLIKRPWTIEAMIAEIKTIYKEWFHSNEKHQ